MVAPVLLAQPQYTASASPVLAIEEAPAHAGVYLLAFYYRGEHTPYPLARASRYTGALHYAGYADNIRERIEAHRAGRGARLCRAAILAGYDLRLVVVWSNRDREYERTLKGYHNLARYCPLCWHGDTVRSLAPLSARSSRRAADAGLWIAGDPGASIERQEASAILSIPLAASDRVYDDSEEEGASNEHTT